MLPPTVAAELARLEAQLGQVADGLARRKLVELGEAAALRALQTIGKSWEVRTLSGYVLWFAKREAAPPTNAPGVTAVESAACSPSASLRKGSPLQPTLWVLLGCMLTHTFWSRCLHACSLCFLRKHVLAKNFSSCLHLHS